jgi:hypothetical protein
LYFKKNIKKIKFLKKKKNLKKTKGRGRVEDFIIGCVTGPFSSISCLLGRISGVLFLG